MSYVTGRNRVTLDDDCWTVVVELMKLRFGELVEISQQNTGEVRLAHRKAAKDLWDVISDIELQLPRHLRPDGKSTTILGPLRDWRRAIKLMGTDIAAVPQEPLDAELRDA